MPPASVDAALHRSRELRLLAAVLVAAVALGLATLEALAEHTDVLMLDFRRWQMVAEPASPAAEAAFAELQTMPPGQRPFRLVLASGPPGAEAGLGAAYESAADPRRRYCFRVLATAPGTTVTPAGPRVEVAVDGVTVRSLPVSELGGGQVIAVDDIRPAGRRLSIGLAVRPSPAPSSPATVRFEYAVLRTCRPRSAGRG